jgi:hypothetical protein
VWVLGCRGSREARLDDEACLEGYLVPTYFCTALNKIEKELEHLSVGLALLQIKVFIHLHCLIVNSLFATNQVERPEAAQVTDIDATSPKASSSYKFMLLTFPKAGTVHACKDEVPQQVLVKAFGILILHFFDEDTHLAHIGGEQKVAISQGVQLCSIPWELQSRPSQYSEVVDMDDC